MSSVLAQGPAHRSQQLVLAYTPGTGLRPHTVYNCIDQCVCGGVCPSHSVCIDRGQPQCFFSPTIFETRSPIVFSVYLELAHELLAIPLSLLPISALEPWS